MTMLHHAAVHRPRIRHLDPVARAEHLEAYLRDAIHKHAADVAFLDSLRGDALAVAYVLRLACERMKAGQPAEQPATSRPAAPNRIVVGRRERAAILTGIRSV